MRLLSLSHGDVLIREGKALGHFYIVKKGSLVAIRAERGLLVYSRGDAVGIETALEKRPAPFTVVANGGCEALEIPVAKFDELQSQSPAELRAMAQHFLNMSDQLLGRKKK
jgi:CRP-like cAMP-binding protein